MSESESNECACCGIEIGGTSPWKVLHFDAAVLCGWCHPDGDRAALAALGHPGCRACAEADAETLA